MTSVHPGWLILASLTISLMPILVGMASAYVKISIVLNLLRSGFGAQGVPSGLVIMALSSALTLLIMGPVVEDSFSHITQISTQDLRAGPNEALLKQFKPAIEPWKKFLGEHAGKREREVLLEAQTRTRKSAAAVEDDSFSVLVPAFLLTELREAFAMGFALLIPFLAIDLIVANVLTGLGMMMASPTLISLPLKVLLFLLVDGWVLLSRGLLYSYGVSQ
jgi:type III secretion protein R